MKLLRQLTRRNQKGFTLIEVLMVVAIIAILAGIVIIAINPGKQLGDTRNAQRQADVTTILNATYQYELDNNGTLPPNGTGPGITATSTEICATGTANCATLVDLSVLTASGKYLVSIPKDPQCSTVCATNGVGYNINKDVNSRLVVSATHAENGKTISVTR